MPVAEHVLRRGGIYHLRCRVPFDLLSVIGRREICRSLKTASPRQAKARAAVLYPRLMGIFDRIRAMTNPEDELIATLLASLDDAEAAIDREREVAALTIKLARLQAAFSAAKDATAMGEALDGLRPGLEGLPAKINNLVRLGKIGEGQEAVAALLGMLGDMGLPVTPVKTPTVMSFLQDIYIMEKKLQDDSHRHIVNYVSLFARITGDRCLADYRRTQVVEYVRTLERMKNSLGKSPKDDGRSIDDLLADSEGKATMNATTIEKHIQHVKAFFRTATKHHRFASSDEIDDMFDDIDLSDFVPSVSKRKRWSMEQLNQLFVSPIWRGTASAPEEWSKRHLVGENIYQDAYWWLPVVALWTGARLEELAQLHHEDLRHDYNGIPYIRIHDEGIRRLKTPSSKRDVPVHSFLISLGFLKLFDPTMAGQRIWPELVPTGRLQKLGDTYSTHFTDYRRRCGLYERWRDYHSFRRTFISTLRTRAKVDVLTVAAMAGHDEELDIFEQAEQTDDYTDYDISPLSEAIERLDYGVYGLDVALIKGSKSTHKKRPTPARKASVASRKGQ